MATMIGETRLGTVLRKTDYGVFVQLERNEIGLVHVSLLRGNLKPIRERRLSAIAVGDEVYVKVIDIMGTGRKRRYRLSEREAYDSIIVDKLPHGELIPGRIVELVGFGAFVELERWHVAGLLHVSEMQGGEREERNAYFAGLKKDDRISVAIAKAVLVQDSLKIALTQRPGETASGKAA